jgi:hypothetical protein
MDSVGVCLAGRPLLYGLRRTHSSDCDSALPVLGHPTDVTRGLKKDVTRGLKNKLDKQGKDATGTGQAREACGGDRTDV